MPESLTIEQGSILFRERVVITIALRTKVLNLLRQGHPGIQLMKSLAATPRTGRVWNTTLKKWFVYAGLVQKQQSSLSRQHCSRGLQQQNLGSAFT